MFALQTQVTYPQQYMLRIVPHMMECTVRKLSDSFDYNLEKYMLSGYS